MEKKRKRKIKGGRKPAVSAKKAEEMFLLYINNIPLIKIGEKYGLSIKAIQNARDRHDWDKRKEAIEKEVFQYTDKALVRQMIKDKDKQLEAMGMLLTNLYRDIQSDYENYGKEGYIRKIPIEEIGDAEKLFKTYFMVVNQGIDKSENTDNKSVIVQISKEDKKLLLKAMAEGKAQIEPKAGNA